MLRYTCSDRNEIHPHPQLLSTTEDDEETIIRNYWQENLKVYDTDNCEYVTYYFAFSSGNYYELTYSYYWDIDEDDSQYLHEELEITRILKQDAKGIVEDRDWLVLSSRYSLHSNEMKELFPFLKRKN
jgi:hypothetical protein